MPAPVRSRRWLSNKDCKGGLGRGESGHAHSVERKPLYHFRPGQATLTLAAPDCNFSCGYCQNAVLSQYVKEQGIRMQIR